MKSRQAFFQAAAALALSFAIGLPAPGSFDAPGTGKSPSPGLPAASPKPVPLKLAKVEDFAPPAEFITLDGLKTHFVQKGKTGPAVVLVHGFGASTYSWRATIAELSQRYRVYALDMKGFGLTAKPRDGRYNAEEYTRHLLNFLDAFRLEKPILIGHSMGGAIATRLALRHPERVRGLVLEAPVPVTMPRARDVIKNGGVDVATAADTARALNPAVAKVMLPALLRSAITRQTVETGLKAAFHDPALVTPEMVEEYYRPITIEGAAEALAAMMSAQLPPDKPLPPLDSLKIPVLLTWGEHDKMLPRTAFEAYARSIAGIKTTVFARSGHVPHEEEPGAFNRRLQEFLTALPEVKERN